MNRLWAPHPSDQHKSGSSRNFPLFLCSVSDLVIFRHTNEIHSCIACVLYSDPPSSHKDRWGSSHVVPCSVLHLPLPWPVKKINPLIAYALPSVISAAVFVWSLKMAQRDLLPHLYYSTIRKTLLTYSPNQDIFKT